ncbi:MAG TPA: hypothetical protein VJP80_02020 [Candidatus Saccharimonadales bacterium]|nr:hypothetical protein [Candidatus Saccharimonadales bacterium]
MTPETPRTPDPAEAPLAPLPVYEQSVQNLFGLLATTADEHAEHAPCRYYDVAWDGVQPARIADVVTMTTTPTGARREERLGLFHQAQFLFRETMQRGGQRERLAWCYTGPQRIGMPIEPHIQALAQDHSYELLTPDNIAHALAGRAETLADFATLTNAMRQHGATPPHRYLVGVRRLAQRLISASFRGYGEAPEAVRDQLLALFATARGFDADVSDAMASNLVSSLLRTIATQHIADLPATPRDIEPYAGLVVDMLEKAITEGIIPDEPRFMHRIMASPIIYRYPFASVLLNNRLKAGEYSGSPKHMYQEKRPTFARHYITAVLHDARIHNRAIICAIETTPLTGGSRTPYRPLVQFLNSLASVVDNASDVPDETIPYAETLTDVGPVFRQVLSKLRADTAETTPEQAALDDIYAENVQLVLAPFIRYELGKHVLGGAPDDEED